MSYPLIVLGAGASLDSNNISQYDGVTAQNLERWKPPLTNDLFNRSLWDSYINRYDEISELATHAIHKIGPSRSLEEHLTDLLQNKSTNNPRRIKELLALRFYLADLFNDISTNFHKKGNNYQALLKELEDYSNGSGVVVNFNYDLLFERNINDISSSKDVDSYISGKIKVIKVHGACNWVHVPVIVVPQNSVDSYIYYVSQADKFINQSFEVYPHFLSVIGNKYTRLENDMKVLHFLPAIAIPLVGKHEHVCPESHITVLKEELSKIDRIILIGWKASDPYIKDLLDGFVFSKLIPLYIVSRDLNSAEEVSSKFTNKYFNRYACKSEGFTKFLNSQELDLFFSL